MKCQASQVCGNVEAQHAPRTLGNASGALSGTCALVAPAAVFGHVSVERSTARVQRVVAFAVPKPIHRLHRFNRLRWLVSTLKIYTGLGPLRV
jgi:hypothetical protein